MQEIEDQMELLRDPFKLPEPVVQNLLKFFKGKELLDLLTVSRYWKNYIESSSAVMNRAMSEVVLKVKRENGDEVLAQIGLTQFQRKYHHVEYLLFDENYNRFSTWHVSKAFELLQKLSGYLKTLYFLIQSYEDYTAPPIQFNQLKKLSIYSWGGRSNCLEKFMTSSSFPNLTQLFIQSFDNGDINKILLSLPKLKVFFAGRSYRKLDNYIRHENQPQLEYIGCIGVNVQFCQAFSETLKELYLPHLFTDDFQLVQILSSLPRLEKLSLLLWGNYARFGLNRDNVIYPPHNNLRELDLYPDISSEDLRALLLAVSEIQNLSFSNWTVDGDMIDFLASFMLRLKKFVCRENEISPEARQTYAVLQNDNERHHFELVIEPTIQSDDESDESDIKFMSLPI